MRKKNAKKSAKSCSVGKLFISLHMKRHIIAYKALKLKKEYEERKKRGDL